MTQSNQRDQQGTPREVPTERHEQGHELKDRPVKQQQQGGQQKQTQMGQRNEGPRNEGQRNEGEGNRTAARAYNRNVQQTAENPSEVERQAKGARKALDGSEGTDLKKAEAEGRKPARH